MKKIKRMTCGLLPLLAGAAVLIEHYTVPNAQAVSGTLPVFIGILMCGVLILTLLSIQSSSVLNWLRDRSAWYTAIFLIFLVLDVLTQKTGIFGPPMFPSPDRLLAELVLDRSILLDCAGNSLKLLFTGYFWGMLIGLLTGIPAGRSRKARYDQRYARCLRLPNDCRDDGRRIRPCVVYHMAARLGQFYENVYSDRYDLHYIFIRRCGAGPAPQADFTLGGECRCLIPEVDQ